MAPTATPVAERRAHVRFAARELNGLRGARVKYGRAIRVLDLSAGGVRFETDEPLTSESTIVLEFSGPEKSVLIPSRVVRCRRLRTIDASVRSQGACVFKRPLGLKDLVIGAPGLRDDDESSADRWLPVIVRYRDGRLTNGYTCDFSPAKSYLHVSTSRSENDRQLVELGDLDTLFFLHDEADTSSADRVREAAAPYGRKVGLVLPSGDQLTGSTLNYSRHSSGVFVYPIESDFGVARVFVTQSGIRSLRLL